VKAVRATGVSGRGRLFTAVMLESLHLENFRGFANHRVPLKETSVLVRANNAGKSPIVAALRRVAIVTDRLRNPRARFVERPNWNIDRDLARRSPLVGAE
jgi:AAA ATPase domain